MNIDNAIHRAQVYRFLADAFLYPADNWIEDLPLVADILHELNLPESLDFEIGSLELPDLQAEHRRVFGLTGLCGEVIFFLARWHRELPAGF